PFRSCPTAAPASSPGSPPWASSLTSPSTVASQPSPKCLIAAGGTAGHVLPALAVGEALRSRGASVAFLSNAESRLLTSGEFDVEVVHVEGFPRRPGLPLARALGIAALAV